MKGVLLALCAFACLGFGLLSSSAGLGANRGSVRLFLSTDCPVSMRISPRIAALAAKYEPLGVDFLAYFPNDLETRRGVERFFEQFELALPFELDLGAEEAKRYGVTHVPTAIVLDAKGRKVYEGALFDNRDPSLANRAYLADALAALVEGKAPKVRRAPSDGCLLMPGQPPPATGKVTFADHVAPILYKHCAPCHRPGEIAPFSLIGYENAKKWAPNLTSVTESRRMPPWKAVEGFGEFLDRNALTELQIETIRRWEQSGAPRGDASKEPGPPEFPSEWALGEPDAILQPSKPYRVEADGEDEYRHFLLRTNFKEPVYVRAMDAKPGNPKVVHHVVVLLDEKGASHPLEARQNDGKEGYSLFGGVGFMPDGSLGGWAPGFRPRPTPPGIAFEIKPGATVVMQVHYHKTGKVEHDQTRLGLYFSKEPVKQVMGLAWLANPFFRIPAGEKRHRVFSQFPVPADATIYGAMPHMHLLGRSMKAEIVLPDGTVNPLIYVDDWDFNWQLAYVLKDPIRVPKGSKIRVEAFYDNSISNPRNPNYPPKPVTWGDGTTDEMFLLVVPYTLDGQRDPQMRRLGFGGF